MKKLLIASAVATAMLGSASTALADVEIYGIAQIGFGYTNVKVDGEKSTDTFEMESGRMTGPRWGFRGKEKINDDLKVSYVLEQAINMDSGTIGLDGTTFFGRECQVSLHTKYGTLAMGRLGHLSSGNSTYTLAGLQASPFAASWGMAGHFNYLFGNERSNNMVVYQSPKMNGFTVYADYSFGSTSDENTSESNNTRYMGLGVTYENPTTYVAVIGEHIRYANKDNTPAPLMGHDNASVYTLIANHRMGKAKWYGTLQYMDGVPYVGMPDATHPNGRVGKTSTTGGSAEGLKGYAGSVSLGYGVGGGLLRTTLGFYDVEDKGNDNEFTRGVFGIGYVYPLSKRTSLYVQASYVKTERNGSNVTNGKALKDVTHQQTFAGITHVF